MLTLTAPCRYLCVVWLLVVAAQDAIMMWAPLLIRDIMDASPTGVAGAQHCCSG